MFIKILFSQKLYYVFYILDLSIKRERCTSGKEVFFMLLRNPNLLSSSTAKFPQRNFHKSYAMSLFFATQRSN